MAETICWHILFATGIKKWKEETRIVMLREFLKTDVNIIMKHRINGMCCWNLFID